DGRYSMVASYDDNKIVAIDLKEDKVVRDIKKCVAVTTFVSHQRFPTASFSNPSPCDRESIHDTRLGPLAKLL
ncbi:MAG TPA: hypothetical protein EYO83_02805, partial [Gemmatimonadetes bacterium]|nr:hypothetical protein [Gemmatimonadota bacterium]